MPQYCGFKSIEKIIEEILSTDSRQKYPSVFIHDLSLFFLPFQNQIDCHYAK
ncbi:protein of unknown function [Xenorhabdus doucetiae]|uniref:Uncharacterized protein n=1 Tax=Xenorhabdus doucetiae TaxID=351671 RepID=A0A068QVG8_9GAMM|nr:protein of unknown function [Xenorhabdus doucetiae]